MTNTRPPFGNIICDTEQPPIRFLSHFSKDLLNSQFCFNLSNTHSVSSGCLDRVLQRLTYSNLLIIDEIS